MTDLATLEIKLVTSGKDEAIKVLSNVKTEGRAAKSAISDLSAAFTKQVADLKKVAAAYVEHSRAAKAANAEREKEKASYIRWWAEALRTEETARKKSLQNQQNYWVSRYKYEEDQRKKEKSSYVRWWQDTLRTEETARKKSLQEQQSYWLTRIKMEEANIKKANQQNASYWLNKMKFEKQAQNEASKAAKAPYQTLGIQSKADIEQQKRAIVDAYNKITSTAEFSTREQAKLMQLRNQKLKDLDNDMVKSHETSWASMTRAVLRWYAAFFVISAAVDGVMRMGKAVFDAGKNAMQTEKAFQEITGSAQEANKEFAFLRDLADRLGQNFWELQDAYKGVLAASKTTNLTAVETRGIFESLIKATTTLGLSSDRTKYVLYALQQMMSKGKISTEELRRQMGESLYGAFGLAAKAMNMTAEEFDNALSNGKIYTDEFLPKFKKVLDDTYSGTVVDAVAVTNKWNEAITDLQVSMAKGGFIEHVAEAIKKFTEIIKDRSFIESLSGLADIIGKVVLGFAYLLERVGHMGVWAHDIGAAFGLVSAGVIDFSDVVSMNFEELNSLIRRFNDDPELTLLEERAKALKKQIDSIKETTGTTDVNADIFKFIGDDLGLSSAVTELASIEKKLTAIKELKFKEFAKTIGVDLVNPLMQLELQAKDTEKALKDMFGSIKPKKEDTEAINELIESLKLERIELLGGKRAVFEKTLADATDNVETQRMVLLLFDKNEALRVSLKSTEDATKEAEKQVETTEKYVDNLKQEIEAIGRSAEATEILKARHAGLTKTRLAEIEAMIRQKHAMLDLRKKAEEDTEAISKNIEEGTKMASDSDRAAREKRKKDEEDALKKQEEDYKHYLERIQDATADAFYDIFAGNVDGWEDMLSRMSDLLMRYLAEWAAQALLKPVIIPVIQSAVGFLGGTVGTTTADGSSGGTGLATQAGSWLYNTYGQNTGLGNTLSGLSSFPLWQNSGQVLMQEGISLTGGAGWVPTSMVGSGTSFTLGNALGAYGLGSLGYSTIGDLIGLPQGGYSGIGAGLGAAGGSWAGTALGTGSGILAGASYGSVVPIIGTIVGAILGGVLGSLFGDDKPDKNWVGLGDYSGITTPFGFGEIPGLGTAEDYAKYFGGGKTYEQLNSYDKNLVDIRDKGIDEVITSSLGAFYDGFEDWMGQLPDDLSIIIKKDLDDISIDLSGLNTTVTTNRGEERLQEGLERIAKDTTDIAIEAATPLIENSVSTYLSGQIRDMQPTLDMLSSNHMIRKWIGESGLFNADFTMKEGADFEEFVAGAGEFSSVLAQIQGAWDAVTIAFDLAIDPLSQFGSAFKDLTTNIDGAITVLEQLGFNEEALIEARTKGLEVLQAFVDKESGDFAISMQSTLNKLAMSDISYSVLSARQGKTERDAQAYDMLKTSGSLLGMHGYANLMGLSANIYEAETKEIAKSFMDSLNDSFMQATMEEDVYAMDKAWKDMINMKDSVRELFATGLISGSEMMDALSKVDTIYDKTIEGIKEAEKAAEDFVDSMANMRSEAMGWINAGIPVISQIESDIEYRSSGLSREDFLRMKIDAFGQQYKAGDMTLADWENAMSTVSEWWVEATAASEAAAQAWEDAADVAKDLAKAIKDTKESLMMGALNVQLPSSKFAIASGIYQEKLFAAKTGGATEIQDYLSFASEYLTAAQENYKSSDTYQQLFQSVMAEMDALTSMVESEDFTQRIFEENKKQTSVLSSIDSGVAALGLSLVQSIKQIMGEKQTSGGFDLTKIDALMTEYGFTPKYEDYLEYAAWMRSGTADDPITQELMSKHGVTDVNKLLADARTLSAWYEYVTAQRRAGNAMSYSPQGFADGGIASGPSSGYQALLHGTELIVPLDGAGRPGQVRNNDSGRPITVIVEVGGEEFAAYIDRRADNVRVKAEKRNMGSNRIMN